MALVRIQSPRFSYLAAGKAFALFRLIFIYPQFDVKQPLVDIRLNSVEAQISFPFSALSELSESCRITISVYGGAGYLDFKRHLRNSAMASISPRANNGQWKWDWKSGSVMCRPAIQKEATTTRPARMKPSHCIGLTLMGLAQEERHSIIMANMSSITEIRTGARTGDAHVIGMRKSISQSIIELGQSMRILSQT